MKKPCLTLAQSLALILLASSNAFAAEPVDSSSRALSSTQLQAIRGISRNVLAAKKNVMDSGEDAAQLERLRSTIDQLIVTEIETESSATTSVESDPNAPQRTNKMSESALRARGNAYTNGLAVVAQLRSHGEQLDSRSRSEVPKALHSNGLLLRELRGRSFLGWAQKLDAALADGNSERLAQLTELRAQLKSTQRVVMQDETTRDTPTMQSVRWGAVRPSETVNMERNGKAHGEAK